MPRRKVAKGAYRMTMVKEFIAVITNVWAMLPLAR